MTTLEATLLQCIDNAIPPSSPKVAVAFSGGVDSLVLLNLCQQWCQHHNVSLRAIHVNHHWQHASDQWAQWCIEHCQQWDIDYLTLDIQLTQNNNIEEHARILRYQAIETVLDEHEALLLGHHADDQAETFIMNAHRQSGFRGLSAMESSQRRCRPFLYQSKTTLIKFATSKGWKWITDPSNTCLDQTRNQIRHQILPKLHDVWSDASLRLCHTARQIKEQHEQCLELIHHIIPKNSPSLSLDVLKPFGHSTQMLILREWLHQQHLTPPSAKRLKAFVQQLSAKKDKHPSVGIDHSTMLVRYQNMIHIAPLYTDANPRIWFQNHTSHNTQLGHLQDLTKNRPDLNITYRAYLNNPKLVFHFGSKRLKTCMQEWKLPPWQRNHWPIIMIDKIVVCIPHFYTHPHHSSLKSINFILT